MAFDHTESACILSAVEGTEVVSRMSQGESPDRDPLAFREGLGRTGETALGARRGNTIHFLAPPRAIHNLSDWLKEDLGDKLDEEHLKQMELMHQRVRRMDGLINGLLEYSRIGRVHHPVWFAWERSRTPFLTLWVPRNILNERSHTILPFWRRMKVGWARFFKILHP